MPDSMTRRTEYAWEVTRNDGKRVNLGATAAPLEEMLEELRTWASDAQAAIVARTVTTTTTDWKPITEENPE